MFTLRRNYLYLLLLSAPAIFAQGTTGDVLGTVTDASGVVPGAAVKIENLATHEIRDAKSNTQGEFVFNLLPSGHYKLAIEMVGFKAYVVGDLALAAGDRARVDATLTVGQVTEQVQVNEVSTALETDTSAVGEAITGRTVQDLPLNGRNFVQLAQLAPGVNEGPPGALSGGSRPDDRRPTASMSANGQSDSTNTETIDGTDNNERIISTIGVRPSIDAIAEFRVLTNVYDASIGRTAGAVINIVTKSGSNQFHGTAYDYFRNDVLNARNFYATVGPKPEYRQNQFGGSVGGPIRKDKTFFFADYEGNQAVQGQTAILTVPTAFEEANVGNFSDIKGPVLTAAQINPIAAKYFALYPAPNLPGVSNNYDSTTNKTVSANTMDARVDHYFSQNDIFFARYTLNQIQTALPSPLPAVGGIEPGGNIAAFDGTAKQWAHNAQLNYVHVFGPNLLLELKAAYTRINNSSYPLNYGQNLSQQFGLQGSNLSPATSGLAPMYIVGYAQVGDGIDLPLHDIDNTFQYSGTVAYTRGTHSIKMGAALIHRQAEEAQNLRGNGFFEFVALTIPAMAEFLEGTYYSVVRTDQLFSPAWRTWEPSVFVQDDWRVTRWLTLNLGARYDVFTPFTEATGRMSNFNTATGQIIVAGQNGVSDTAGVKTDYGNFAPRLGFAAALGHGLVVRGGYGISFFPDNYASISSLLNAPYTSTYSATLGNLATGLPLTLAPQSVTNPTGSVVAEALNFKNGYLHQFNVNLQKQIGANVFSVGYVGELGRNLLSEIPNIDVPAPSTTPVTAATRPFYSIDPGLSTIQIIQSTGVSSYHAMQLTLQRRFTRGLSATANYTWAHGINDVGNISSGNGANGYGLVPSAVATLDRGNSDIDIRHRFAATFNYELPFGKGLTGRARYLASGWQVNGIFAWETGLPFTVTDGTPEIGTGASSDRPNRVSTGTLANPSLSEWFDITAFAPQPLGTVGNSPRNPLYGPHQRHFDFSLFKDFRLYERAVLEFRAEAFNISNTPNFGEPNSVLRTAGFGSISSTTLDPREVQFALKLKF
jgi:hypothetical protein